MNKITRKEFYIIGGGILLALIVFISFIMSLFQNGEPSQLKPTATSIPQSSVISIPEPRIRVSTKSAELVDQSYRR